MKANTTKVKVEFFGGIRQVFKVKERRIVFERVPSIRNLLALLTDTYERRQAIFVQSGQIRPDVNILRNGRHIYFLNGIETQLEDGDTIAIYFQAAGG